MRTTFFLTGLVAALVGTSNALNLSGESTSDAVVATNSEAPA